MPTEVREVCFIRQSVSNSGDSGNAGFQTIVEIERRLLKNSPVKKVMDDQTADVEESWLAELKTSANHEELGHHENSPKCVLDFLGSWRHAE